MARSKAAQFRVSEEEDQHLRQACLDAGFDQLSEYLRAVLLEGTVVAVTPTRVVVVPSTITTDAHDERFQARLRAILTGLRDQTSPGESGGMVGTAPSQGSPASAAAQAGPGETQASAPPVAPMAGPDQNGQGSPPGSSGEFEGSPTPRNSQPDAQASAAGAGRKKTSPRVAPLSASSAACPDCGGSDGRHQGFCVQVTGEQPADTEAPERGPETQEAFIARRVGEQEAEGVGTAVAQHVAEAEWRNLSAPPAASSTPTPAPPAPEQLEPCPTCGTMKAPSQQCRDCGTRPTTI